MCFKRSCSHAMGGEYSTRDCCYVDYLRDADGTNVIQTRTFASRESEEGLVSMAYGRSQSAQFPSSRAVFMPAVRISLRIHRTGTKRQTSRHYNNRDRRTMQQEQPSTTGRGVLYPNDLFFSFIYHSERSAFFCRLLLAHAVYNS